MRAADYKATNYNGNRKYVHYLPRSSHFFPNGSCFTFNLRVSFLPLFSVLRLNMWALAVCIKGERLHTGVRHVCVCEDEWKEGALLRGEEEGLCLCSILQVLWNLHICSLHESSLISTDYCAFMCLSSAQDNLLVLLYPINQHVAYNIFFLS
jgi:hypothetical protein